MTATLAPGAATAVTLADDLHDALGTVGLSRWAGWVLKAEAAGVRTVLDLLSDFPSPTYEAWTPDDDWEARVAAGEHWLERNHDLRSAPGKVRWHAFAQDADDFTVLLRGTYFVSDSIGSAPRSTAEQGAPNQIGMGILQPYGLTTFGLPDELDGQEQWVVGTVSDEFKPEVIRTPPAPPLPRWSNLSRGSCALRSLAVTVLLNSIDWTLYNEPAWFGSTLETVHSPGSEAAAALGAQAEYRASARTILAHAGGKSVFDEPLLPVPRMLRGATAAEQYAAEVLAALGFDGARVTPPGADGGIDVTSETCIAQVKMEALATGRPAVQALYGVAAVEGKAAVFFSLAGYTARAMEWADRAGVACLQFAFDGSIEASNEAAAALLAYGAAASTAQP